MSQAIVLFRTMQKEAVQKAERLVARMRRALDALSSANTPDAVESAWIDFIMAAGTVYSSLEQGAKLNSKSLGWFGRQKHTRKTDPLLRYIHQARNSEEHGIAPVTKLGATRIRAKAGSEILVKSKGTHYEIVDAKGDVEIVNDTALLIRVHDDRFGNSCDPPMYHLGRMVEGGASPLNVAKLAMSFIEKMVSEAHDLAT